jgi:nucleotide-binding universal stress UspA family protein
VIACLDGSAYAGSVCDHAAWLAGPRVRSVDLLHAVSPKEVPRRGARILERASARLEENGASVGRRFTFPGALAAVAAAEAGPEDLLVLGKRGETPGRSRRMLGSDALAVLRATPAPLLLVSKVHLPLRRALVLIDAEPSHRRAAEFAARAPALAALERDVVLMQPSGLSAEPKLTWARRLLEGAADVYPMAHGSPGLTARRVVEDHGVDLIVVSREMLFEQERASGVPLARRDLWAMRTPIFVC